MTAAVIPDDRALRDPSGACIADERQALDNAGFAARVTAVAAVFAAAGLSRGDVLAIMLPNQVELITSMFAAWRLGAAVTPVNPALTAHEARYQIDDAGAALVVAGDAATAMLRDGPHRIIGLKEVTALVTDPGGAGANPPCLACAQRALLGRSPRPAPSQAASSRTECSVRPSHFCCRGLR